MRACHNRRMPDLSFTRLLCAGLVCWAASLPASAGDVAWTANRTSTGLHALRTDVVVSYAPTAADPRPGPGARVTRVHAARRYAGDARVATRLCWRSADGPCVELRGTQLDTHAFDGLAPEGPFLLVHRALNWVNTPPPLFIPGSVTVWFSSDGPR